MNDVAEKPKAHKVENVCIDVKVECDFSRGLFFYKRVTEEERAKALQVLVDEFKNFLADHRSQDYINFDVIRETEDQCSLCKNKWEEVDDEDGHYCACCGADIAL